jgi:hypothetical protein
LFQRSWSRDWCDGFIDMILGLHSC